MGGSHWRRFSSLVEEMSSPFKHLLLLAVVISCAVIGMIALPDGDLQTKAEVTPDSIETEKPSPTSSTTPSSDVLRTESTANLKGPVVRGRFVLAAEFELEDFEVTVSERYNQQTHSSDSAIGLTVHEDGAFEYRLKDLAPANLWFEQNGFEGRAYRLTGLKFSAEKEYSPALRARVDVESSGKPQYIDLGEVELIADRPMVHGVIRYGNGGVVARRLLSIHRYEPQPDGSSCAGALVAGRIFTDRSGEFAFFASEAEDSQYVLVGGGFEFEPMELVFQPFGEKLIVEMVLRPHINGRILVDPEINSADISIVAVYEDEDEFMHREDYDGHLESMIQFSRRVKNHTPVRLEFVTRTREPIYLTQEYTLASGQSEYPAELNPLDLRGKLRVSHISVFDSMGNPLTGRAEFKHKIQQPRTNQIATGRQDTTVVNGEARIAHVEAIPNVVVSADGFNAKRIPNLDGDITVVLEDGLTIQVQIPQELTHYRDGVMKLYLSPMDLGDGVSFPILPGAFDGQGIASVQLPRSGEYQFRLDYRPLMIESESELEGSKNELPRTISIAKQSHHVHSNNQVITLHVSNSELAKIE